MNDIVAELNEMFEMALKEANPRNSRQIENYISNNVILTFVQIFRNDHLGEWSFKEIGYRLNNGHSHYLESSNNFNLIDIPRDLNENKCWEISKNLLDKGRTSSEIQSVLNYIKKRLPLR